MGNYLTEKEGLKKLKCSRNTFRKIADNAGATIKISDHMVRYDEEAIDNWLASKRLMEAADEKIT